MLTPLNKSAVRTLLPPLTLAVSLGAIYLATIAPGLSWANDGADGGDFISAAATGGIAHPTGYPLYLLIARPFQFIPLGSLAFRTNLLSALAAVLAACLIYAILVHAPGSPAAGNWLAGMSAGYALGISPVFWSQAVITEVYTLHTALVALSLLVSVWQPGSTAAQNRLSRLRGLIPGLAVGNHLTAVFLIPGALLSGAWTGHGKPDWRALGRILLWLAAGLLIYLALPLRALSGPVINWGNPLNWPNFSWLVSGSLYQRNLLEFSGAQILERGQAWAFLMRQQFEIPGLALGFLGLVYFFKPNRLYFITLANAVIFSLFAILYSTSDSYVYLLPVFVSFALWMGLGLAGLLDLAGKYKPAAEWAGAVVLLAWFALLAVNRWPLVDASHDLRADQFGTQVMREAPPNALLFVESDRASFALWYYHFALGQRPDLTVIVTDLLHFEWYDATLRAHYPRVQWPEGFLWVENIGPANPALPVCEVSYYEEQVFTCQPAP